MGLDRNTNIIPLGGMCITRDVLKLVKKKL